MSSDLRQLRAQFAGGERHRAGSERAEAARVAASGDGPGLREGVHLRYHMYVLGWNAEFVYHDLGGNRLVSLSLRSGRQPHRNPTAWIDVNGSGLRTTRLVH